MNWYSIFYWVTRADSVKQFFDVTSDIFKMADAKNIHTQKAAMELAEKRINDMLHVGSTY